MIDDVISWLNNLGVVVHVVESIENNQYIHTERRILLKPSLNKIEQLFSLLHEAGHAILNHDEDFHETMYPFKYHEDPEIALWLNDLLKEEYDAWGEGYELAERLKLDIDLDAYEVYADKCLNTYRGFASTITDFSKNIITIEDEKFKGIMQYFVPLMK